MNAIALSLDKNDTHFQPARSTESKKLWDLADEAAASTRLYREREVQPYVLQSIAQSASEAGQQQFNISIRTLNKTVWFLQSLPSHIPLPTVVLESAHEIGLDWQETPRKGGKSFHQRL